MSRAFLACALLFALFAGARTAAGADAGRARQPADDEEPATTLKPLPLAEIEVEAGAMAHNLPGHAIRTQRRVHLRLGQAGDWFADCVFEEELLWGYALDQVNHTFDYLRLGRSFGPISAFIFWNHTCNNIVWERGVNTIRWNDLGVEITTNPDPGAGRAGPLLFRARAAVAALVNDAEYKWVSQASARWQPQDAGYGSPFAEIVLDVIGDPERVTLCPTVEFGFTTPLGGGLALEPFVRWERRRDAMGYGEGPDDWFLAGLKIVQLVGPFKAGGYAPRRTGLHMDILAGYAGSVPQKEIGYASNVRVRLVAPGFLGDRSFFEVHAGISTPPEDMVPNFDTLTAGPSVETTAAGCAVRASYRYRERWAVWRYWSGDTYRNCHVFRLELSGDRWDAERTGIQAFAGRFRWEASLAVFPFGREFPYTLEAGARVRVFLFPIGFLRAYFSAETRSFLGPGDRSLLGGACEFSVLIPGFAGDARVFFRTERGSDPFRFGEKHHNFLGFDLNF